MKEILIKNPDIIERLNGFSDQLKILDPSRLPVETRDFGFDAERATSAEYLEQIIEKGHKGFPQAIKGCDIGVAGQDPRHMQGLSDWAELREDVLFNFTRELGCQQNALFCYYPEDGYIGWHDNHDCPGHTILFNWSETGSGFYRYRDVQTGEIVTIPDKPGWSCKTGTYGKFDERGVTYHRQYHCARSNGPRWSIAFFIRNLDMVEMIRDEIEYSDG